MVCMHRVRTSGGGHDGPGENPCGNPGGPGDAFWNKEKYGQLDTFS